MRWKELIHKEQQIEIKTRFLWFPKTLDHETRWLEKATWRRHELYSAYSGWYWVDDSWVD